MKPTDHYWQLHLAAKEQGNKRMADRYERIAKRVEYKSTCPLCHTTHNLKEPCTNVRLQN